MPKRISPKFCARRRSQIQKLSYVVPNPSAKLGLNEPWPECQPELFQNDADGDGDGGGGDAGTTHPSWQVSREHHAQGSNIPFGESLTLISLDLSGFWRHALVSDYDCKLKQFEVQWKLDL